MRTGRVCHTSNRLISNINLMSKFTLQSYALWSKFRLIGKRLKSFFFKERIIREGKTLSYSLNDLKAESRIGIPTLGWAKTGKQQRRKQYFVWVDISFFQIKYLNLNHFELILGKTLKLNTKEVFDMFNI